MRLGPNGRFELDDQERGTLIVSAACSALLWAAFLGTIFTISALIWSPEKVQSALWWYPFAFVAVFLWRRRQLLARAQEIIDRKRHD